MLSPKSSDWRSGSGALSSFSLAGLTTNSRNYRNSASRESLSNVDLLRNETPDSCLDELRNPPTTPLIPMTHGQDGYNFSEQTFALNWTVESCVESDPDDEEEVALTEEEKSRKRGSFLEPPGETPWWNWDAVGDLHLAHTQPMFYTVQDDQESLQSVAAKFKITPTELKRLNKLSNDFIFVGQKLKLRN